MQKTILITGATDGIGLETAKALLVRGHHLIIHGRNIAKLQQVKSELQTINVASRIDTIVADLSNMQQVKAMAQSLLESYQSLDVIINNAGVYKTPITKTSDGLDIRFVVNTLAPYYLTKLLTPLLNKQSRVLNLSSAAQQPINFKALYGHVALADMQAYAQSKRAIRLWSKGLSNLPDAAIMISVNPGSLLASKMVKEGFGVAGSDLSIGVNILLKLAFDNDMAKHSGEYFDNDIGVFSADIDENEELREAKKVIEILDEILANLNLHV